MRRFVALAILTLAIFLIGAWNLQSTSPAAMTANPGKAYFAGGCFWSMELAFEKVEGVLFVTSGFMGGTVANPSYEEVSAGRTGHAESVEVIYDPSKVSYQKLLDAFWHNVDPVTPNAQFCDHGRQYRSVIFYRNDEQRKEAKEMIAKFNAAHVWPNPIVTEVQPFTVFYKAEDYHMDFYRLHPNEGYCRTVIAPEIAEFRTKFKAKLKK